MSKHEEYYIRRRLQTMPPELVDLHHNQPSVHHRMMEWARGTDPLDRLYIKLIIDAYTLLTNTERELIRSMTRRPHAPIMISREAYEKAKGETKT